MKRTLLFPVAFVLRLAVLSAILSSPLSVFAAPGSESARSVDSYSPNQLNSVGTAFVHIAHSANTTSTSTYIDHPLTDGHPNAIVFVTPNYNPGGVGGTYEDHRIGVWYDAGASKWAIFNQDSAAMATDEAFNVLIPPAGSNVFVQTASVANISAEATTIDNALINNNPNAMLFVTPNYNPGGSGGTYDNHPIGVRYSSSSQRWSIFNEDFAAMPVNAAFNVFVSPTDSGAFIHRATLANIFENWTDIDSPITNNNPNLLLFVTPNLNPGAIGGIVENHNIGVFYDSGVKKWSVFNQDVAAMLMNTTFNVLVAPPTWAAFAHVATTSNISMYYTVIDNPLLNGNPSAIVLATPYTSAVGGTLDDHPIAAAYSDTTGWVIVHTDRFVMPIGAAFNVLVFATDAGEFVHKATAANIGSNVTEIYYPLTNGNPDAIVLTTPTYVESRGDQIDPHPIGVWYNTASHKWTVFNQDLVAMPLGAAFNVFVPPAGSSRFVHTASPGNIGGSMTYIDNALTNNRPNAMLFVTPNWNPGGSGGTYDNHNIGVWYVIGTRKWAIFNQDGAAMPSGAAFNVYVSYDLLLPLIRK